MKKVEELDLSLRVKFALALATGYASQPEFEFTYAACRKIFQDADRLVSARNAAYRAWKARPPGWFNLPKDDQAKLFADIEKRISAEGEVA